MARRLTADDVEAGVVGGLFLSAGGSGRSAVAKNRGLGRMALDYGGVQLISIDELDPHAADADREHLRAQQHHAAHLGHAEVGPDARRVRTDEVLLQLAHVGRRDADNANLFADKLGRARLGFHQAYPGRGGDLVCEVRGERVLIEGRAVSLIESRLRLEL